ncbi:hypothetical protein N8I77_000163 [Diaporthe amygdali]|uniref:Uncharacterized protein n=1 Tax=Phomopsis amygdali TaxID=1214568 RepID=A0AAD9SP86_PHOAM|nr:hypothetical protein N8I77_000163 [Diaporthe amygdali]
METLMPTEDLLKRLQDAGAAYKEDKHGARERLTSLCYTLIASLESPSESLQRIGWAEPARNADCRTAIDLKLFELMKEDEEIGVQGVTAKELAGKAGADEVLISRMMKHLAAMNVVGESGPDTYILLPFSRSLTEPRYRNGIICNQDLTAAAFLYEPKYLRDNKHELPSPPNGPFQAAFKTDLPIAEWCQEKPRLVKRFDQSKGDILFVAIGASGSGFLRKFNNKFPDHPGRLILQEKPEFLEALSSYENIFEGIPTDKFDPHPIQGARAYYLLTTLRGKSEQECVNVLEQLKSAIEPGYSVVLLNEIIVPTQHASWRVTSMDRLVNATHSTNEWTEADIASIIKQAGFKTREMHRCPMVPSTLIEIILDSDPLMEDGYGDDGAMENATDPDPDVDADVDIEDCIVVATD